MTLKKSLLCLSVLTWSAMIHLSAIASGNESSSTAKNLTKTTPAANASGVEEYICDLYNDIDFGKGQQLNREVFTKAMYGYLNLQEAGRLNSNKQILSVADFTQSSTQNRLWVIDLARKKVLYNTYVAHGQGSGMEMATSFSNVDGTHASSLGFYVTTDCYNGAHGNSLRLNGVDKGYNDAALSRGIVMHAAEYVSEGSIAGQGRIGRSWGCPAVKPELAQPIINTVKGGTCLFIYYPQASYLKTAYWMNKKVTNYPGSKQSNDLQLQVPGLENEHIALRRSDSGASVAAAPNRL
jgi:hypothetical protein